jgi:hypothetical protein
VTFFEIADSGISTVDSSIAEQHRQRGFVVTQSEVPSIPLSAVLEACPSDVIHWLKIDVEGSERSALASWGISTRRPWIVVVESTLPLSQIEANDAWEDLLVQRDYRFVYFDGLNRFYVAAERSELESRVPLTAQRLRCLSRSMARPAPGSIAGWRSGTAKRLIRTRPLLAKSRRDCGSRSSDSTRRSGALHRQGEQLPIRKWSSFVEADERLLEESRMLNGHIRALLAELQQRQLHALEERERLNEAHRQIRASLETAVAEARCARTVANDARQTHKLRCTMRRRTSRALVRDTRSSSSGSAPSGSRWSNV